jgi:hypothetical protein
MAYARAWGWNVKRSSFVVGTTFRSSQMICSIQNQRTNLPASPLCAWTPPERVEQSFWVHAGTRGTNCTLIDVLDWRCKTKVPFCCSTSGKQQGTDGCTIRSKKLKTGVTLITNNEVLVSVLGFVLFSLQFIQSYIQANVIILFKDNKRIKSNFLLAFYQVCLTLNATEDWCLLGYDAL